MLSGFTHQTEAKPEKQRICLVIEGDGPSRWIHLCIIEDPWHTWLRTQGERWHEHPDSGVTTNRTVDTPWGRPRTRGFWQGQQRHPWHHSCRCHGPVWASKRQASLRAFQMILRQSQTGWALEGGVNLLPWVQLLRLVWALLPVGRMLFHKKKKTKKYCWQWSRMLPCSPLTRPVGRAETYSSEGPVPDSGCHIDKVLCLHVKVFQPAGDVTAGGGCAVLSDQSRGGGERDREDGCYKR